MKVLVDSSIWIAFFRGSGTPNETEWLIEEGLIVTNELVLAELVPPLLIRGEKKLVKLLRDIELVELRIDWADIIDMQTICIKNGINKVGIPDLIIAQNAMQNGLSLFTLDKHFEMLGKHVSLMLH